MQLTPQMIAFCEKQKWDEDLRQEVYVKVLECDVAATHDGWLSTIYSNLLTDKRRATKLHADLIQAHYDTIVKTLALDGTNADPMDIRDSEQQIEVRLKDLSYLLRATLDLVLIEGYTPEELAEREGTTANVIYQRIHQARKLLKGE